MRIRLVGPPGACDKVTAALRTLAALDVTSVSPHRPTRGQGRDVRVYIDADVVEPDRATPEITSASPAPAGDELEQRR